MLYYRYSKGKEKGKMVKVILKDKELCRNDYLELTDEQYRLLNWLNEREFLDEVEVEVFEDYEFKKI